MTTHNDQQSDTAAIRREAPRSVADKGRRLALPIGSGQGRGTPSEVKRPASQRLCFSTASVLWHSHEGLCRMRRSFRSASLPLGGRTPERSAAGTRHGWSSPRTTVVWAVVASTDAEAVHRDLEAGFTPAACDLLLNRAVELLPLASTQRPGRDHTDAQPDHFFARELPQRFGTIPQRHLLSRMQSSGSSIAISLGWPRRRSPTRVNELTLSEIGSASCRERV